MTIERLTAEDRLMLWPDELWPQDMGALVVLDAGSVDIDAVRAAVAARLHQVPRLRSLLYVPPAPLLGGPLWVDAPAFDVRDHVRTLALEPPGDEAQLLQAAEQIRSRRLDRSKPLWEIWVLSGMRNARTGLFVRMHHSLGDGIAGVATLATLLDTDPSPTTAAPEPWSPASPPTEAELLEDAREQRAAERGRNRSRLVHPLRTARGVAAAWPAVRELVFEPAIPATSLERLVGPGRSLALVRGRIDAARAIAHENGAKVNDVLLAAIAAGLRALLMSRGEPVTGTVVRVFVPVSLRHGQYAGATGNDIGQMVVPIPVGLAGPVERLRHIAAQTAMRKARVRPSLGLLPTHGFAGRMMLKLIGRQHVNVTSADLPGPPVPLYLAGYRLLEVFPMLPLISNVTLGVGALSYAGQFNVMAVADRDAYPDLGVFAAAMRAELASLEAAVRTAA